MSDQAFADAALPAPVTILRVPLLNYSVGHELLLNRHRNPIIESSFNSLDSVVQRRSIIRAVIICSRTWKENKCADRWLKLWGLLIRKDNFEVAIADFRNYLALGSTFPTVNKLNKREEGRTLGSSFLSRLVAYGASIFGDEVFDQPFGMLCWIYYAHLESEGAVEIENDYERQAREMIESIQKENKCQL